MTIPTTFAGRKAMEKEAFKVAQREFAQLGWTLVPLALDRETILPLNSLLSLPLLPPQTFLLICLPDAIGYCEATEDAHLIELKSTHRETFSVRLRDFIALLGWEALLVVVNLTTGEVRAELAARLPAPAKILVPQKPSNGFDAVALEVVMDRFPDVPVLVDVPVAAGSAAPFGVWSLSDLQPLSECLGGDRG